MTQESAVLLISDVFIYCLNIDNTLGTRGFFLADAGRNRQEAEPRRLKADITNGLLREKNAFCAGHNGEYKPQRKPRKKSLWHPG